LDTICGIFLNSSRKRNKKAAQNYLTRLKISLNLIKTEKSEKQGVAGKRLMAGWSKD